MNQSKKLLSELGYPDNPWGEAAHRGEENPCSPANKKKRRNKKGESLDEAGLRPGTKVKVAGGSGIDSDKTGVVVDWKEVKTDGRGIPSNVQGRHNKPPDRSKEVPVKLDKGGLIIMFKNRLIAEGSSIYEVILKQRDRDSLEELIDKHGLDNVIETIAEIAFEKEEHIEQGDNGPTSLSRSWGKDAKALDTMSARLAN